MSASARTDRRRRLIAALHRHDIAGDVAVAVHTLGIRLRDTTARTRKETGALVNVRTGAHHGPTLAGTARSLELGPLLRDLPPGEQFICVHTHPDGGSFSPEDAALVIRFRAICVITAVERQGGWYILSLALGHPPPSPQQILEAFEAERDATVHRYRDLVQSGALKRVEAQRQHSHQVWEKIAPALGLRYDRVT